MSAFSVVSVCESSQSDPFHIHTHNHAEIIYVKTGKILFEVGDRKYHAQPGDVLLVGRLEPHGTHIIDEPYTRLCINISYDSSLDFDPQHRLFSVIQNYGRTYENIVHAKEDSIIQSIMQRIIYEFDHSEECREEIVAALTQVLLVYIFRKLPDRADFCSDEVGRKMLAIKRHIDMNFTEPITVEQIAKDNFISADYLTRKFKAITGYTPKQYLTDIRLEHARKLLLSTELTISAVATQSGFTDVNNFIRRFRQCYGKSPGSVRRDIT